MKMNNQLVAGIDAQRGRLDSVVRDIAIARRPLSDNRGLIAEVQSDFQNAVVATQLGRVLQYGTGRGTRTSLLGGERLAGE